MTIQNISRITSCRQDLASQLPIKEPVFFEIKSKSAIILWEHLFTLWQGKPTKWPYLYLTDAQLSELTGLTIPQISYAKQLLADNHAIQYTKKRADGLRKTHYTDIANFGLNRSPDHVSSRSKQKIKKCNFAQTHKEINNTKTNKTINRRELLFSDQFKNCGIALGMKPEVTEFLFYKWQIDKKVDERIDGELTVNGWCYWFNRYLIYGKDKGYYPGYVTMLEKPALVLVHDDRPEQSTNDQPTINKPPQEPEKRPVRDVEYPWPSLRELFKTHPQAEKMASDTWCEQVEQEFRENKFNETARHTPEQWQEIIKRNTCRNLENNFVKTEGYEMGEQYEIHENWQPNWAALDILAKFGRIRQSDFDNPEWQENMRQLFIIKNWGKDYRGNDRYWNSAFQQYLIQWTDADKQNDERLASYGNQQPQQESSTGFNPQPQPRKSRQDLNREAGNREFEKNLEAMYGITINEPNDMDSEDSILSFFDQSRALTHAK